MFFFLVTCSVHLSCGCILNKSSRREVCSDVWAFGKVRPKSRSVQFQPMSCTLKDLGALWLLFAEDLYSFLTHRTQPWASSIVLWWSRPVFVQRIPVHASQTKGWPEMIIFAQSRLWVHSQWVGNPTLDYSAHPAGSKQAMVNYAHVYFYHFALFKLWIINISNSYLT